MNFNIRSSQGDKIQTIISFSSLKILTSSLILRIFPIIILKATVPAKRATGFITAGIIEGISNLNSDLNLASKGSMR